MEFSYFEELYGTADRSRVPFDELLICGVASSAGNIPSILNGQPDEIAAPWVSFEPTTVTQIHDQRLRVQDPQIVGGLPSYPRPPP